MKNYFLPMLLSLFFLGACDKNDEIIPEDADENFITSVVMTVDGKSYTADIADNTVTITVPYTVSLNNAEVEFKYTTSATTYILMQWLCSTITLVAVQTVRVYRGPVVGFMTITHLLQTKP